MNDISHRFPELPIEVQVALINAASSLASAKVAALSLKNGHNSEYDFFKKEYERICDALYKENRGRT